jgi:integrase
VGRIQRGKGDKYRETSLTYSLAATINADTDVRDGGPDDSLISRTTRTVRDWVTTIGERLAADTGDEGWTSVEPHDLRRTWGTLLVDEAEPGLVMEWGSGRTGRRFERSTSEPTRRKRRFGRGRTSTGSNTSPLRALRHPESHRCSR